MGPGQALRRFPALPHITCVMCTTLPSTSAVVYVCVGVWHTFLNRSAAAQLSAAFTHMTRNQTMFETNASREVLRRGHEISTSPRHMRPTECVKLTPRHMIKLHGDQ